MTDSTCQASSRMPPRWVLIIVGLLVVHAACMLIAVRIATREKTGVIPDYYQKAQNWDRQRAATRPLDKH